MFKKVFLSLAAVLLGVGCHSFGPSEVGRTHPLYNEVISRSLNEQFLLNLVRLRYRDNPYFLEVGNVAVNTSLESELSASVKLVNGGSDTTTPSGSVTYKQNPTVSYTPLRGNQFLKQMLSPVPLEALLTLTQSGWSVQRVMSTCVERANDLDNAANASGPTPVKPPRYEKFATMADILRELQMADAMELGAAPAPAGGQNGARSHNLVLRFKGGAELADRFRELCLLLDVPEDSTELVLTSDFLNKPANGVAVRTRSMMGIMFYLSHNIAVPGAHEKKGLVTVTQEDGGDRFDWAKVTGRLFAVHSASSRPADAFLAVPYRGSWFYLRANDLESKSTFMLLNQLFNLQAGDVKTIAPAFTIGVGG
ncbi:MAG: hypothetical protein CMO74_03990 [Verrucomicrobiales bacterium]|nr:hypothetical protein [Verrucomicrobiales bacterium]|tara:strand:+ start:353 stop:1450 length:1098 start_codon:yes stop_codon:yes gene_type:complete